MPTESVSFRSTDGLLIEGRLIAPEREPAGVAVLCHPHPQYGGTMSSGPIPAIWRALGAAGWAALRFNFRGVGRSEGAYGRGVGEVLDAEGALALLEERYGERDAAVAGWSFGALVALQAALGDPRVRAYAGLAPPVRMSHEIDLPRTPDADRLEGWKGRALAVCGTEDPFCSPRALEEWAAAVPRMETRVLDGTDHFFTGRHDEVAAIVASFVAEA